jgi:acyl carrier protein
MEQAIAGVWQKMFGVEQVSIEDNFFDLGGHSLLLVQTHSRLLETLRIEFPIVTLFEHPTVRSLASHLGHAAAPVPEHAEQWRDRAQQQKQALAQLRTKRKKERQ